MSRRRAGVLLHLTSLPDSENGALGQAARNFVDWLQVGGFTVWQVLPLGPVGADGSPYFARSNHAGDPRFIDLTTLADQGLVNGFHLGTRAREDHLAEATRRLKEPGPHHDEYEKFRAQSAHWLPDYALFMAMQVRENGRPWWKWPEGIRNRNAAVIGAAREELAVEISRVEADQYFFYSQWRALRQYAAERGVMLFGDVPIYLAPDSVEVWANRELFQLDGAGRPTAVAGVPPDYFSAEGQLWGNPLYQWEEHQRTQFQWWIERLRAQFALFDLVRLDHFRGLEAYWAVPTDALTTATGEWRKAPGKALLTAAHKALGCLELVAEDLGVITQEVEALRDRHQLPGMRIAQFGFDRVEANPHALHRWTENSVGYTGTHDNDTLLGWFRDLDGETRQFVADYVGSSHEQAVTALTRAVLGSVAHLVIVPMQDLLELGAEARMNLPGTIVGNWLWRFSWQEAPPWLADRCRRWNHLYGRV